jgi:hypothetical protein
MVTPAEAHNAAMTPALKALAGPILLAGGGGVELMIAAESLIVGVALLCIRLGGDEAVLDVMLAGAKARLAELRLGDVEPEGQA